MQLRKKVADSSASGNDRVKGGNTGAPEETNSAAGREPSTGAKTADAGAYAHPDATSTGARTLGRTAQVS